jgi:hypothetical protein
MRYLLKKDQEYFNLTKTWIAENMDKRTPDLNSEKKFFTMEICVHDLQSQIMVSKLTGKEKTELDIIRETLNNKLDFVVTELKIDPNKNNGYLRCFGHMHSSNKEFLHNYNKVKYFENLQVLTKNYFESLGFLDYRNLYEEYGSIYYGKRAKNQDNAYLLGEIIPKSGKFVMTCEEYDEILTSLKDETNS